MVNTCCTASTKRRGAGMRSSVEEIMIHRADLSLCALHHAPTAHLALLRREGPNRQRATCLCAKCPYAPDGARGVCRHLARSHTAQTPGKPRSGRPNLSKHNLRNCSRNVRWMHALRLVRTITGMPRLSLWIFLATTCGFRSIPPCEPSASVGLRPGGCGIAGAR